MPVTYEDGAVDWFSTALPTFGSGSYGTAMSDDIPRRFGRWGSADTQMIRGQRTVGSDQYEGRIALGLALRQIAVRIPADSDRAERVVAWWTDPHIESAISVVLESRYAEPVTVWLALKSEIDVDGSTTARDYDWTARIYKIDDVWNPRQGSLTQERFAALAAGSDAEPPGLVFEPAEAGGPTDLAGVIRPTDELLEPLPVRARQFAHLTVLNPSQGVQLTPFFERSEDNVFILHRAMSTSRVEGAYPGLTGDSLVERARTAYRAWLQMSRGMASDPAETARMEAQRRHRQASADRFMAFRQSKPSLSAEVIPTLPFVPHGLASSRRWGIEIESGGAHGVAAPGNGWIRKTDGSLRSAWQGYVEVQDFEPHDEERTEMIAWSDCTNSARHMPGEEYYDESRRAYAYRVRSDYIPVAECAECGERTRTVRVEPQTITHTGHHDDCAEFVSPILVSMHSNGLEELLEAIKVQPQNDSSGVHVHVESNDLTDKQIATLVYGYDLLEPIIEASYRRNVRRFCERRDASSVLAMARVAKRGEGGDVRNGQRYLTVNTQALSQHGTIEFRAMGPVYDYDHLVRWAMFCREMVNSVVAGATQKDFARITKWEDVLTLFARFGKEYIRAVVYEMTGETGSVAALAKSEAPPTTEAFNDDFNAVFDRLTSTYSNLGSNAEAIAARLVQADGLYATV
jgi:hypothetical protein